jgi:hypothetical protein
MTGFQEIIRNEQIAWRRRAMANQEKGKQNRGSYDHVLPRRQWEQNLWPGIRSASDSSLPAYLAEERVTPHTGVHNLCSSWILCANLYFPFRSERGRGLIADFLRATLSSGVLSCDALELEYEHAEIGLQPHALLGEGAGARGTGQTSPDVAFLITTDAGPGIVLVESKYGEHSFYQCSAFKLNPKGRPPNPDRSRCSRLPQILLNPAAQCHAASWGRRYWEHLQPVVPPERSAPAADIVGCPAAYGAYQLLRQQALGEALARTGRFPTVVSAVAFDSRNQEIFNVLRTPAGKSDLRDSWALLFSGKARFWTFTHQSWVAWVRENDTRGNWTGWLAYIADRYGY